MPHTSNDSTKYYHVLAALDQDTAVRISDGVQGAQRQQIWCVKNAAITSFRAARVRSRRTTPSLDIRRPWRPHISIKGRNPPTAWFKTFLFFMQTVARTQLAESDFNSNPRTVANQATTLWRAACLDNQMVGKTSALLSAITKSVKTPSAPTAREDWCYFRRKFGKAARKCQLLCSFLETPESAISHSELGDRRFNPALCVRHSIWPAFPYRHRSRSQRLSSFYRPHRHGWSNVSGSQWHEHTHFRQAPTNIPQISCVHTRWWWTLLVNTSKIFTDCQ